MRGNDFEENKVIPLSFKQFLNRSHLNKLDRLTTQDVYCVVFAVVVYNLPKYFERQITFKNNFKNFNLLLCNYFTSFIWNMFPWFDLICSIYLFVQKRLNNFIIKKRCTVVCKLVGKGYHQNFDTSLLTYKCWLIFMAMKQKKNCFWKNNSKFWSFFSKKTIFFCFIAMKISQIL